MHAASDISTAFTPPKETEMSRISTSRVLISSLPVCAGKGYRSMPPAQAPNRRRAPGGICLRALGGFAGKARAATGCPGVFRRAVMVAGNGGDNAAAAPGAGGSAKAGPAASPIAPMQAALRAPPSWPAHGAAATITRTSSDRRRAPCYHE